MTRDKRKLKIITVCALLLLACVNRDKGENLITQKLLSYKLKYN